jgi:multiple sugar transport system ATP-binding protein
MAEVRLSGVTKRYGNVEACSDVDLTVPDGEFVTLLGPSGCGKSTTLNVVAGLDDVTSGEIRFDGRVVNDLSPLERDVAMVFQSYALYPHMTVAQNLGFTLKLRRRSKDEIRRRVEDVAASLELTPLLERLPRELSGGQQQRVALGRAVIREPQVFLFDEPFSNLDAALRVRMRTEIKQLHQRLGITSLFVTHDQEEALSISDRVAVMRDGRIVQVGRPEEIYARPSSTYVARFIGSPQLDILRGDVRRDGDALWYGVGRAELDIDRVPAAASGPLDLGIRPEHVLLGAGGVPGTVVVVQPIGPATLVTVGWDGGQLTARVPGIARMRSGDRVGIRLDPQGLLWFDRASGLLVTDEADGGAGS